jgi:sialate O-acetylesterase
MKEKKELRLHGLLRDGMILQRDADAAVWGWAAPGNRVTVRFLGHVYEAEAGADGAWSVTLERHKAGGPYQMEVESGEKIVLRDIYFGDVWLLSGQSNMQLPLTRVKDEYPEDVSGGGNPLLRQFTVPELYDFSAPCDDVQPGGAWETVRPDTVPHFSAAGYFFAKELYRVHHVPVGLIQTAIGGASVAAWMSREALAGDPELLKLTDKFRDGEYVARLAAAEEQRDRQWFDQLCKDDEGLQPNGPKWFEENVDESGWGTFRLPAYWCDEGVTMKHGAIWFRKKFTLPAELAGKPARLFLGRIVDADFAYVNGSFVGTTAYRYPPRKYDVPAGLLREGENTVAVRVLSFRNRGGFIEGKPYRLIFPDRTVELAGEWKYRVGAHAGELPDRTFLNKIPVGLFNGMFSPVSKYAVKGVLWYQGESDTSEPDGYEDNFVRLITDWRKTLRHSNLPFLYVQLPNYVESESAEAVGKWPLIREAQRRALRLPGTAMAVTIDIGEWNDLHPVDKKDVGVRLALAARKVAYGEIITGTGPLYRSMKIDGNRLIVTFTEIGSGLVSKDGERLRNFEVAGEDGVFFPADAKIMGDSVVLTSGRVASPCAARYAWSDCPRDINFYNREGLPASPFLT